MSRNEPVALMVDSPLWIEIPASGWLAGGCDDRSDGAGRVRFRLHGTDPRSHRTEHVV